MPTTLSTRFLGQLLLLAACLVLLTMGLLAENLLLGLGLVLGTLSGAWLGVAARPYRNRSSA